ncbi:cell division protein FtsL [Cognatishimia sp. SS12]|uniref:cell division protein FtsL n=1 Tax=Cognatishimia sp. SS12 TaxID=2979465 RepID=UPI00232FF721|nr:cell division protein FtsL [Cognatishimia sp. SS12]MDC0736922.1 cell division protein FtsL [Cognatishimia sp. SS12]
MRSLVYVMTVLFVISLAFWAYRENYATQEALGEIERLQGEIGTARNRVAVLKAEWAYLNRPDRLRDLAELNFERLQLLPLRPDQFGMIQQVAYPPMGSVTIDGIVEVSSQEGM